MTTVETEDPWAEFDDATTDLPRLDAVPRVRSRPRLRPLLRKVLAAALVLALAYVVQAKVITSVVFEQRQLHLAADMSQPRQHFGPGDALGYLQIPKIGMNVSMVEGVTIDNLRSGPAHVSGTALPGDAGVMVLYGHRSTYGSPFEKVGRLVKGDEIVAKVRNDGPIVAYVVERVERHIRLSDIRLDKTEMLAYALLVTGEAGIFNNDVAVVVARALPVTATEPVVADLSAVPDRGFPFGLSAILGDLSALGGFLTWRFLRGRTSAGLRWIIITPIAVMSAITVLAATEWMLPVAR